jgi:hypothetical protein
MGTEEPNRPSLLEQAKLRNGRPGPTCGVANILADHPLSAEVADLIDACVRKEVQFRTAAKVLGDAGIQLRPDAISRHSNRLCACVTTR